MVVSGANKRKPRSSEMKLWRLCPLWQHHPNQTSSSSSSTQHLQIQPQNQQYNGRTGNQQPSDGAASGGINKPTTRIIVMARPRLAAMASLTSHVDQPLELRGHHCLTDYFLNYVPEDVATRAQRQQQINELKEEVRKELFDTIAHKPTLQMLEFIDDIQRLGLGYHFEDEIEQVLHQIYNDHDHSPSGHGFDHEDNLYHASLRFRLLRRQGFHVPCDIFKQFLDENGNLKLSLSSDVQGMISLYEASHLRIRGEDILDEALTFTTARLKVIASRPVGADYCPLMAKVVHALEQPLHHGVARLESRHYISLYEKKPDHNEMLLKFAKLDYNFLQSLHKEELANLTRWYTGLDITSRIAFQVRNVLVEIYYCGLGLMDERPQYALGRIIYTKLVMVGTILDDLYDICDIADLELLTEVIQRWDKQCVNQLPKDLKLVYSTMLDTFEEVEQHLAKEGRSSHAFHFAVEAFKTLWTFHLQYSKWLKEEYVPTFEDYMTTCVQTIGIKFMTIVGYLGLSPEIATQEVFKWALQFPKVMEALCTICRIEDDIADDDFTEKEATHKTSAVSCYMKQYKVTDKRRAYEELRKMFDNPWKDINEAMLRPTVMPMPVLERILTQTRSLHVLLKDGDGFTFCDQTPMKKNFLLLFRDPIPF